MRFSWRSVSAIRNYLSVFWIILGIVYFGANVIYTMRRYREEGGLTIKQIGIGVLASVPILMGAMLLVWGLPTVMPEQDRPLDSQMLDLSVGAVVVVEDLYELPIDLQ